MRIVHLVCYEYEYLFAWCVLSIYSSVRSTAVVVIASVHRKLVYPRLSIDASSSLRDTYNIRVSTYVYMSLDTFPSTAV